MSERLKDGVTPMQSKKFLAYLIAELSTKGLMAWLITHIGTLDIYETTILIAMILSSSALTVGYVLGVASLEKYLHAAVEIVDREDQHLKKEIAQLKGLSDNEYHEKHKDKVYKGDEES
jgi:hypothetical protein